MLSQTMYHVHVGHYNFLKISLLLLFLIILLLLFLKSRIMINICKCMSCKNELNRILPVSAATFPIINTSVAFSYGSISMMPLRMVSVTFAPAVHSSKLAINYLYGGPCIIQVTIKMHYSHRDSTLSTPVAA